MGTRPWPRSCPGSEGRLGPVDSPRAMTLRELGKRGQCDADLTMWDCVASRLASHLSAIIIIFSPYLCLAGWTGAQASTCIYPWRWLLVLVLLARLPSGRTSVRQPTACLAATRSPVPMLHTSPARGDVRPTCCRLQTWNA